MSDVSHILELERPIHVTREDSGVPREGFYSLLLEAKGFGDASDIALEDLLTALCVPVRRFATFRLRHLDDSYDMAEDVVQETLIRVAKGIRSCTAVSDFQFLAWVKRIARNTLTDMYRSPTSGMADKLMAQDYSAEMKALALDWQQVASHPSTPARSCLLRLVMEAYGDASHDIGELFWLRLIAGLEWGEVAVHFNTTTAGAKRRFQRAQATLQRAVQARVASLPDGLRRDVQSLLGSFEHVATVAEAGQTDDAALRPERQSSNRQNRALGISQTLTLGPLAMATG